MTLHPTLLNNTMSLEGLPEDIRDTVHELISKHDTELLETNTASSRGSVKSWLLPEGREVTYVVLPDHNPHAEPSSRRALNGGKLEPDRLFFLVCDYLKNSTHNFFFQ